MRVSPKKRTAKRINALKSTGPKTASGRRASTQNATRHGLSVPLPPQLAEPVQQQLVQLILSDGFDHDVAHDLAGKVIEYEPNINHLKDIHHKELILPYDPCDKRGIATHQKRKRQAELLDILTDIEKQELEVKNQEELQVEDRKLLQALNQMKLASTRMIRSLNKLNAERVTNSQRYFKRASNQLLKMLRRL